MKLNLFEKKIKPSVYYISYEIIKTGAGKQYLTHGYCLEDVIQKIEDEEGSPIKMIDYLNDDLEEIIQNYTEESISLKQLKQ